MTFYEEFLSALPNRIHFTELWVNGQKNKCVFQFWQNHFITILRRTISVKTPNVSGDFNLVQNDNLHKDSGSPHSLLQAQACVVNHAKSFCRSDVFGYKHPTLKRYYLHSATPVYCTATKLDFFLINQHLLSKVTLTDIVSSIKSDHPIVTLIILFINEQ